MYLRILSVTSASLIAAACGSAPKHNQAAAPDNVAKSSSSERTTATASQSPSTKAAVAPAAAPAASADAIECANGKDTRQVRIETGNAKGCQVMYSKHGGTESVASAESGTDFCKRVSEKIKGNLESAGFKCAAGNSGAIPERKAASK